MQGVSGAFRPAICSSTPTASIPAVAIEPPALLSLLHGIDKQRGGAEVLDRFYKVVFRAVDDNDGVIDHLAGNGVMALWTPRFGGRDHTTHPLTAGRQLVAQLIGDRVLRGRIPAE